jgi:D-alanyl-D-alanine-carboxypeptidase/D-alanyl-D-alanine-endopeptidase
MLMRAVSLIVLVACGSATSNVAPVQPKGDSDPEGPNRARVASHVQPLIDHELATSVVVGIVEGGRREIYGFGKGPGGKPPNGATLFELGGVTKVYTGLLLADSVQRREVNLDTPVAELLPTGVTVPTRDKLVITLRQLALHSSGLPPLPPSLRVDVENPFALYRENHLYQDLIRTQLVATPGERMLYSDYGFGLLAHALGRKIGGGYAKAIEQRVTKSLALVDTFATVPKQAEARRATGSTEELVAVKPWSYDALLGTGGLVSSARDQLAMLEAQIEASEGNKGTLRPAMRLTQESQLERSGDNQGLGWMIDSAGRYWQNGETAGFHAFVGFDPKARRGIVILASTRTAVVDSLATGLYRMLAGEPVKPPAFPDAKQLASYAGTYDFQGMKLAITAEGKRLYVEGPGEPRIRMMPISDREFYIERLQSIVVFEREGDAIRRAIFIVGDKQLSAPRVDAAPAPSPAPAPKP